MLAAALVAGALCVLPAPGSAARQAGGLAGGDTAAEDPPQELPVVTRILVEGNRRYGRERLLDALGQEVGTPFDDAAINRGLQRLWELYRVRATTSFRPVAGGLELRLTVVEVPVDLEPRFVGNSEFSTKTLMEWGGLVEDQEVFFNDAQRIARLVREGYLREGHFFAEVKVVTRVPDVADGVEVAPDIIFEVVEGPHVAVDEVIVHGNDSMPDTGVLFWKDGLKHLADLDLGSPTLGIFTDDFVEEVLDADIMAMREVYRRRGYLDAVVELERLDFSDDREWVTIHVQVDEGPRYRVGSLRIEGIELVRDPSGRGYSIEATELLFPEADLLNECELTPGAPFQQGVVDGDRGALGRYYGARGYIDHPSIPQGERFQFLDPELVFDVEQHEVDVIYRVVQGRRQFLREVVFSGGLHTRDAVLRRLVTVFPGEQADLPEIFRSLNRIRGTGYFFDRLNPGLHPEPTFRFLETDDPGWKDLLFEVEEGSPLSFAFGGGVSTNSGLFGQINLRMSNFDVSSWPSSLGSIFDDIGDKEAFHGAGQELFIFAQPGTEIARFEVRFTDPDIFDLHFDRIGFTVEALKRLRRYRSHDEERDEFGVRFSHQVGPDSSVYLGYRFAEVLVDDLDTGGEPVLSNPLTVPALLKAQEGESDVSYLDLGWRMNTQDHPLNPRSGTNVSAGARVYDTGLGSDFSVVRAEVAGTWYQELGDEDDETRPGMRYRLGAGVAEGYDSTEDVPYTERFFLGGSRLRGFRLRGVGPNQNGHPIGGETYLYASAEYRFPLVTTTEIGSFRETESIRGFLFADAGVLDPQPFALDPDEVRASVGFGVGLSVGLPLVLTFGFPVIEGAEDRDQRFSFNLGF